MEACSNAQETKRRKAKELRYRKAIAKDINLETIQNDLWEIAENCDGVRYYFEDDEETLLNALDGDADDAFEFRMMFADLCAECERMQGDMDSEYIPEYFDDFFVAVGKGEEILGWDSYEGDYYGLFWSWEEQNAQKESRKRITRLTKEKILETAQTCFRIFRAYIGIRHRYDCLKTAMDILRDENTGYLQIIKRIEEVYERANADDFYGYDSIQELERLTACLPAEAWLQ